MTILATSGIKPSDQPGKQPPPSYVPPNFDGMPAELKDLKNWILWVPIWNGSKWTKRPIQPSGYGASTTNPAHWRTFEEVKKAYEEAANCGYVELREKDKPTQRVPIGGIGFVFDGQSDENGLVLAGVDFDHVISGAEVSSLAQERIMRLGSYTEKSVSGNGLHVIVKARPLSAGVARDGVELYTSGRFFTMTGCVQSGAHVVAAPDEFSALAIELKNGEGQVTAQSAAPLPSNVVPFERPEWTIKLRPAPAFAGLPIETLSEGLEPNIEEIRAATAAIPPSAITTEPEWMIFARSFAHEAALHKDYTEQLWQVLDAASCRAPGYNRDENRRRFERYMKEAFNQPNPITIDTLYYLALQHGWDGRTPSTPAMSGPVTAPPTPIRAVHVSSLPLTPPKRQWLHGTDLIRGAVTVLAAPGGRAKSTWLLACALACASGRPLLGSHVFGGPLRVLCLSTEDGMPEMALRLRAAMQHFGLTDTDVPALYVIGADRWGLPLLQVDRNRAVLDAQGINSLVAELDQVKPDILIIDPLINVMGGVSANENAAAAVLMGRLVGLAIERRMAVALAHHASKGRDPTSAESAMGAVSFINLARVALSIDQLEEKNAGAVGLPPWEARSVFRVIHTKQNLSQPKREDRWFRLISVPISNAEPPVYMSGDDVAVVEPFHPGSSGPMFPADLIRDALHAIGHSNPPLTPSKRSPERYAAPILADAIKAHRSGHASETEGKAVLDHLISTGLVAVVDVKVSRGRKGSDIRKGLVLTEAGKLALQQGGQTTSANETPQPPQPPATALQHNAGGDPLGSPATQGGCGGNAGAAANVEKVLTKEDNDALN